MWGKKSLNEWIHKYLSFFLVVEKKKKASIGTFILFFLIKCYFFISHSKKNTNSYSGFCTKLYIHLGFLLITVKTKSSTKNNWVFSFWIFAKMSLWLFLLDNSDNSLKMFARCFLYISSRIFAPFAHNLCRSCALTFLPVSPARWFVFL